MAAPPCTNFDLPPIRLLLLFSSPLWTIIHPTTNQPSAPFISQLAACQLIGKLSVCFLNAVVLSHSVGRSCFQPVVWCRVDELKDKRVRLCLKVPEFCKIHFPRCFLTILVKWWLMMSQRAIETSPRSKTTPPNLVLPLPICKQRAEHCCCCWLWWWWWKRRRQRRWQWWCWIPGFKKCNSRKYSSAH